MDLEQFGDIIDRVLTDNHVQLLIDMPPGTQAVTLEDTIGLGPVPQFYILLKALPAVFREFSHILKKDCDEKFIDGLLDLVKEEILEAEGDEHE